MSTRCNVIIKDSGQTLFLYRHSDGYPDGAGADLIEFVQDYKSGAMRTNPCQSAGWLVVRGHFEYKAAAPAHANDKGVEIWAASPDRTGPRPNTKDSYDGWECGAYEITDSLHGDVEYIYIIDLEKLELSCRVPKNGFWDNANLKNTAACKEFKTVSFACGKEG